MSDSLEDQVKQLKNIIFNMLNFTSIYVLILDNRMNIKFINNSLAVDLGFRTYKELLGRCWMDFIDSKEKNVILTAHNSIINKKDNWEDKYKELKTNIVGKNGEVNSVYWFNSHINSDYNLTLSFGIKKNINPGITIESVRNYYKDILDKDRLMILSMKDTIKMKEENEECLFI